MKTLILVALLAFSACVASAQAAKISPKDLKPLEGGTWVGSLTYVDYGSGKRTAIKSNILIAKTSERIWSFDFQYPDEPKANSKGDVKLANDGRTFDDEIVVERTKLSGGVLKVVTERPGKDNDKPATIRHTYLISKTDFSIRKDVKPGDKAEYFERNTYTWRR